MSAPPADPRSKPDGPSHDAYAAWRHVNFRLYLGGFVLVWIAQQMITLAVEWEIYTRTAASTSEAAMALGWVGLTQALPVILLALPAGHLADRCSRKAIVILSTGVNFAASGVLVMAAMWDWPLAWVYGVILVEACSRAVGWTARGALLPQLVPEQEFANAATWNSTAFQVAAMTGPAVGGLLAALSVPLALVVAMVLQLGSVAMMAGLRPMETERRREPITVRSLMGGVRFVRRTPLILATITLDLFAVLLGGAVYLLPIFSKQILHTGAVGFGALRAAPAVGAVAMALWLAHRRPMRRPGSAMLWAVAGFGVATVVFGVSRWFWLSAAMLAVTGALDNISVVVRHTLVQMLTPDEMRGRVTAVNNVFISASNDLGGLESGFTAAVMGPIAAVVAGGIGTVLVVVGAAAIWPELRRVPPLHELRPVAEELDAEFSPESAMG